MFFKKIPGAENFHKKIPGVQISHKKIPGAKNSPKNISGASNSYEKIPETENSHKLFSGAENFLNLPEHKIPKKQLLGAAISIKKFLEPNILIKKSPGEKYAWEIAIKIFWN